MGKAKSDNNDDERTTKNRAAESDKELDDEEGTDSDSSSELGPVSTKKGEPSDNLRRRSDWFQKRH